MSPKNLENISNFEGKDLALVGYKKKKVVLTQLTFTCSKGTIETLNMFKVTIKTLERRQ